jgi:platelet-activating factor acetylhydrolase
MSPITDYLFSLHYFPIGASVVLPSVAWYYGAGWMTCAALCTASLSVSAIAFYVEPLLCFGPMGGRFNVGLRELRGNLGAMHPPVSAFYPTTAAAAPHGVEYLPFNDPNYARGIARYISMPYFLLMDLCFERLRVCLDAPAVPLFRDDGTPRPIAVFSHGLAGFPRLYSTLLMDIAARGVVVLAVTHMDASAAYCRDAGTEIHIPLNTQLKWTVKDREPQLDIRVRETRSTIARIRSGELLRALGYEKEVVDKYVAMDLPIHLIGHSFGGATVLTTSLEEERAAKDSNRASSVASVVTYDPWSVPLREKMFYARLTDTQNPYHFATPTLQFFSEGWFRDKAHCDFFGDVHSVVAAQQHTTEEAAVIDAANRKLQHKNMTWYTRKDLPGTGHITITDSSLFSPVVFRAGYMTAPPRATIVDCAHDTVQFINTLSGPIPLEKDVANDPVLAAVLRHGSGNDRS